MLITIPGANFENAGLGQIVRFHGGMPDKDLLGLYLFDGGEANGATLAQIADKSGNGNDASLADAYYTNGVQRSYGLEGAGEVGAKYSTGIEVNDGPKTIIWSGQNTHPGGEASVYTIACDAVGLNLHLSGTSDPSSALLYDSAQHTGSTSMLFTGAEGLELSLTLSMVLDGPNDSVHLQHLGESRQTRTDAGVGAHFDGVTPRGPFNFGAWKFGSTSAAGAVIGKCYGFAVYDRAMTEPEVAEHMGYLQAIGEGRGITFS